jgi:hypothetical protein
MDIRNMGNSWEGLVSGGGFLMNSRDYGELEPVQIVETNKILG